MLVSRASSEVMPSRLAAAITRDAGALGDLDRNRVDGLRQPLGEAHLALVAVEIIVRLPVADPDRRVDKTVGRPQAGFEPSEIDERLKRRAGLTLRLGRAVELALPVIPAADHRAH